MASLIGQSGTPEENEGPSAMRQEQQKAAAPVAGISLSVPKTIPGAFEHEPLAGFLRSLTSRENFLFNHCKLLIDPEFL